MVNEAQAGGGTAACATSSPECATTAAAGLAGKAELLSGIEGTRGRLVRRILLWG
jgi:hypothetical protein